jgi:site-specific DNA-adenine methylase
MNYGTPYKGSKNALVETLCEQIPSADTFVDLFAGGCAVTHRMLLLNKYKRYIANDLDGQGVTLFRDAINGKYHDETRWITREEFNAKKATDPYIALVWAFGNGQEDYLYSKEITEWKHALHLARVRGDFSLLREMGINGDGSRADVAAHEAEYKEKYIKWWLSKQQYSAEKLDTLIARCKNNIAESSEELRQYLLRALKASGLTQREVGQRLGKEYNEVVGLHRLWERPESLQRLESLERLQRLQSLQSLQRLEVSRKDYRDVKIPDSAVVYADPPYKGTAQYKDMVFDSGAFYDWCGKQKALVVISEYAMPNDRFACVWKKSHTNKISRNGATKCMECLFVPRHQLALYRQMQNRGKMRQLSFFSEEFQADGSITYTANGQHAHSAPRYKEGRR